MASKKRKRPKRLKPRRGSGEVELSEYCRTLLSGPCPNCGRPGCGVEHVSYPGPGQLFVEVEDKGKSVYASVITSDHPGSDDLAYRALFLGEGEEDLTEAVITELVKDGWQEADLRRYVTKGARYNRLRNSVVFPPKQGDIF